MRVFVFDKNKKNTVEREINESEKEKDGSKWIKQ